VRFFYAGHRLFRPFYRYIVALDTATWGQFLDRNKDFLEETFSGKTLLQTPSKSFNPKTSLRSVFEKI
jgi:hypothetical protein